MVRDKAPSSPSLPRRSSRKKRDVPIPLRFGPIFSSSLSVKKSACRKPSTQSHREGSINHRQRLSCLERAAPTGTAAATTTRTDSVKICNRRSRFSSKLKPFLGYSAPSTSKCKRVLDTEPPSRAAYEGERSLLYGSVDGVTYRHGCANDCNAQCAVLGGTTRTALNASLCRAGSRVSGLGSRVPRTGRSKGDSQQGFLVEEAVSLGSRQIWTIRLTGKKRVTRKMRCHVCHWQNFKILQLDMRTLDGLPREVPQVLLPGGRADVAYFGLLLPPDDE